MSQKDQNTNCSSLEESLQEKLEQFAKAEEEGTPKPQLSEMYKELKELHYELAFCRHNRNSSATG